MTLIRIQGHLNNMWMWIQANLEMSQLANGKRRKLFYDFAAALDDLEFSRAFGPGILAAFFYGIISGSMSFVNKVSKSQNREYSSIE